MKLVDLVSRHSNPYILDIGCNDGSLLKLVNSTFKFGIEANSVIADKARREGINVANIYLSDNFILPFSNSTFDIIVIGEIIDHIFDTDYSLNEIHRVLLNSGVLLITTPNIASFGRRLMLLFGYSPIIEDSPNREDSCGHIRYFTPEFDTKSRFSRFLTPRP